jgi:hypothetical protein
MAVKQGKDFIVMTNKTTYFALCWIAIASLMGMGSGCNKNTSLNEVPSVPVSIRINMDLPLYFDLKFPGNSVNLDGGNKGITLLHGLDGEYYALDRMCTHQPFDACSRVELDRNYTFRCGETVQDSFITCCTSTFQFDGFVSNGPALFPLRRYRVFREGNILDITN